MYKSLFISFSCLGTDYNILLWSYFSKHTVDIIALKWEIQRRSEIDNIHLVHRDLISRDLGIYLIYIYCSMRGTPGTRGCTWTASRRTAWPRWLGTPRCGCRPPRSTRRRASRPRTSWIFSASTTAAVTASAAEVRRSPRRGGYSHGLATTTHRAGDIF